MRISSRQRRLKDGFSRRWRDAVNGADPFPWVETPRLNSGVALRRKPLGNRMKNELSQDGSFNIGIQDVRGTVNVTQILGKSLEYKDLLNQLETQRELFAYVPENETEKRLRISQAIAQLTAQIEQFQADVTRLAAEFNRIEINTDRLRRAKEHFEQGEIAAARAVFDSEREQMQDENNRLVREKERYEQDVLPKLKHSSDEYYLRALLERTAYDNPNWLADTCEYFERSISVFANEENMFQYALFLKDHNRLNQAEPWYQKYLDEFARDDPDKRAKTLNSLGLLHKAKNEFGLAEAEYSEALQLYQQLAAVNPAEYLPGLAMTLNNSAILHRAKNELAIAEVAYSEALRIDRQLAADNPAEYLPGMAMTLNNLAVLHKDINAFEQAAAEFGEALQIRRQLAAVNPMMYSHYVATTLNNLAGLHSDMNELAQAEAEYVEALQLYRQLAAVNPAMYLPYVAGTLVNIALYYLQDAPNRVRSINLALESVKILLPLVEDVPYTKNYLQIAYQVLERWSLSEEDVLQILKDTSA